MTELGYYPCLLTVSILISSALHNKPLTRTHHRVHFSTPSIIASSTEPTLYTYHTPEPTTGVTHFTTNKKKKTCVIFKDNNQYHSPRTHFHITYIIKNLYYSLIIYEPTT